jgi:hypothetical protein
MHLEFELPLDGTVANLAFNFSGQATFQQNHYHENPNIPVRSQVQDSRSSGGLRITDVWIVLVRIRTGHSRQSLELGKLDTASSQAQFNGPAAEQHLHLKGFSEETAAVRSV